MLTLFKTRYQRVDHAFEVIGFDWIDTQYGTQCLTQYPAAYDSTAGHISILYIELKKRNHPITSYIAQYLRYMYGKISAPAFIRSSNFTPINEILGFDFEKKYRKCISRELCK